VTTIWAHLLAGQDAIGAAAPRVESELLKLVGHAPGQRMEVNVHPTCGWISMVARDQLLTKRAPALPSAADAKSRAGKFLLDVATKLKPTADLPLIFMPPVPGDPIELVAVPHPAYPEWNHWLYRTQPRLPTSRGGPSILVLGSAIEVRIGDGGRIIGFHSRWRPTTGNRVSCDASPAPPPQPKRSPPTQVYVLDGAAIPQAYLAAYWMVDAGDDFDLVSGCSLALSVDFDLTDTETSTTVRASVAGGSGDYEFGWARVDATDPFDGIETLGAGTASRGEDGVTQSTIQLAKAAHLVMVHVVDRQTGAFKHYHQLVVSSPFSKRQELLFATPDPTAKIDEVDSGEPVA
jgi:hypothetical protein